MIRCPICKLEYSTIRRVRQCLTEHGVTQRESGLYVSGYIEAWTSAHNKTKCKVCGHWQIQHKEGYCVGHPQPCECRRSLYKPNWEES